MRSKMVTSFVLITALSIFLSSAKAEVPGQVNYQGYLTDTDGYPIDGIVDMEFAIYSQEFEGTPIWFEEHYGVTVTAGVYNVILGETSSISYELFLGSCWLEVAVGEEGAAELEILEPRQPIVSSFFAIYAHNADYLDGIDSSDFAEAEHGHSFSELTGMATDTQIPDDITINYAANAGDADTVDGMDSLDFAVVGHDHSFGELTGMAADTQIPDDITINYALTAGDADTVDGYEGHAPYTDEMAIEAGQPVFVNETGDTITGDLNILGNVGIGTTSPGTGKKLHVAGNAEIDNHLYVDGVIGTTKIVGMTSSSDFTIGLGSGASNLTTFKANGNVGIGTTGPDGTFHVHTGSAGSVTAYTSADDLVVESGTTGGMTILTPDDQWGYLMFGSPADNNNAEIQHRYSSGALNFLTRKSGSFMTFATAGTEVMRIKDGNVGIGIIGPAHRLHVYDSDMKVAKFESSSTNSRILLKVPGINYGSEPYLGTTIDTVRLTTNSSGATYARDLEFGTDDTISGTKMVIKSDGNVGIGTTDPQALLQVAGDVLIDGNIAAKYQDVAEWVESPQKLKPGTVVVIDKKCSNRVVPSNAAYDTGVAGVVSKEPGLLLGEAGNGKYKISHSGRVKTKVDASFGAIMPGDLLVASPIPGVAMKSEPFECNGRRIHQPGTILGKALESLDEGEGMILVLISLH